jgi:hypothetical protein
MDSSFYTPWGPLWKYGNSLRIKLFRVYRRIIFTLLDHLDRVFD